MRLVMYTGEQHFSIRSVQYYDCDRSQHVRAKLVLCSIGCGFYKSVDDVTTLR